MAQVDPATPFSVRTMTADEVGLAVQWALGEGWNPGLRDADCFRAVDPEGFWVGLYGDRPVSAISVVNYDDAFAFLGFYLVHHQFRGLGFGWRTWKAGIAHANGRLIGLDGVVAQQENYKKSGFTYAYANIRFGGTIRVNGGWTQPANVVPLIDVPLDEVAALDRSVFPAERRGFLDQWRRQDGHIGLGLLRSANGGGRTLAGFGVIRPCFEGFKIGPLVADTAEDAEILLLALARHSAGGPVLLDVPQINRRGVALAGRYGLKPVFETARMYTGAAPDLAIDKVFGVTTFELG